MGKIAQKRAPDTTLAEAKYLRQLADSKTRVRVKLEDNSEVEGVVEFFDVSFIRLTRKDAPNLFVFKHDIKYLYELP